MLFGKDRGPIYSHYDIDRPGNVDPVRDFVSHTWSQEDMAFLVAHKIAPGQAEPGDIPTFGHTRQEDSASLRAFLQMLAPSATQTGAGLDQTPAGTGRQSTAWPNQHRNAKRTQAQSRAALVGIIIWFLFILLSMLMSAVRR